jgi:hypothetical protein
MLRESIFTSVNNLTRGQKTELTGSSPLRGRKPTLACSAIYEKEEEIISPLITCRGGCVYESEVIGNLRHLILVVLFRSVNLWYEINVGIYVDQRPN